MCNFLYYEKAEDVLHPRQRWEWILVSHMYM
jgi:hypothetical protein